MSSHLEVTFPPNPNPRKPRLVAPPGSWDTHFHVYGPPHLFPYSEKRRYTPPAAPVEHWMKIAAAIGIDRGVMVQPSVHGTDTAVTLNAVATSDGRLRGIIRADSSLRDGDVRRLHSGGVRGVRFPFAKRVRGTFDVEEFRRNVARVEPMGWIVEFQIDGDMLEEHVDLIANVPLPTILDRFAGVPPEGGVDQPAFRTLLDLVSRPNIWIKMHGADRHMRDGARYEHLVAMNRALIARAADRIIWGTDWPHSEIFEPNQTPDDAALLDMLLDFAPDPGVREKILRDNPQRLFGSS